MSKRKYHCQLDYLDFPNLQLYSMNHSKVFYFYYSSIYSIATRVIPVCHYTLIFFFVQFYFCSVTAIFCPYPFILRSFRDTFSSENYIFFSANTNGIVQRQILNVLQFIHIFWQRIIETIQMQKTKKVFDFIYKIICICVYIFMCTHTI